MMVLDDSRVERDILLEAGSEDIEDVNAYRIPEKQLPSAFAPRISRRLIGMAVLLAVLGLMGLALRSRFGPGLAETTNDVAGEEVLLSDKKENQIWDADVVLITKRQDFPEPRKSARTALCMSGGGSRALSLAMGQFRALTALGILPGNIDAISSVSGGSWASSQYMFADRTEEELLGAPVDPASLTMDVLNEPPPDMGKTAVTNMNLITGKNVKMIAGKCYIRSCRGRNLHKKAKSKVSDKIPYCKDYWKEVVCTAAQMHEAWIENVGDVFLGPYGLNKNKYMVASDEQREDIISRNSKLKEKDFIVQRPDRPKTFIMGGTLLSPLGYGSNGESMVSFQMSPQYTGSPFFAADSTKVYYPAKANDGMYKSVGAGMVETFAFGGPNPKGNYDKGIPAPLSPFALRNAVGISSAAFAEAAAHESHMQQLVNPRAIYWPILPDMKAGEAETWTMGDGGSYENMGLLAMLQSGADKLAVFVQTSGGIQTDLDLCNEDVDIDLSQAATTDFTCLFGHCDTGHRLDSDYGRDQVFEKDVLRPLLCTFKTQILAGLPAVSKNRYKIVGNSWWGIEGGWEAEVIFVYNSKSTDFEKKLPDDTQAEIAEGDTGDFARYPFYRTMGQNPPNSSNLNGNQVNLLAAQGEYVVKQNKELFCELFTCS